MKIGVLPAGDEGDASARPTFIQSERRSRRNKLPVSDHQEIRTEESRNEGLVRSANRHPHTDRRELGGVRLTERLALNVYFSTRKL